MRQGGIALVVDARLGDHEDRGTTDDPIADGHGTGRPGRDEPLGHGEVGGLVDIDASVRRDGQADRHARFDEPAGAGQRGRVGDVERAGQEHLGSLGADGAEPLVGRQLVMPGRGMGGRHAHDPGPTGGVEPLDGPDQVLGLGQGRRRLDEDDRPEPCAGLAQGLEGVDRHIDRRRRRGRQRRWSLEWRLGAPGPGGGGDGRIVRAADHAMRAAVQPGRGQPGRPGRTTDERDATDRDEVLAGHPLAAAARRDQEEDAVRHGSTPAGRRRSVRWRSPARSAHR